MNSIIEVNHLSKKYRYGELGSYLTLRDSLTGIIKNPFYLLNKYNSQNTLKKNEFWALKDISFKISQGEAVGIIGLNGAGKSTLLKILSQITPPTSGGAILNGRVGTLLEVGTGFQQELTGRENIFLNGAILGMTKKEIDRKFDQIVDFSGVEKFLDSPVKHYSSGMYMRLAFSVAAHLDSEILIVDEVLAVGDNDFQKKCLGKMDEITKKSGRTILFVSHNMDAVANLCNRTICLNQGKIIKDGNTDNVIDFYNNLIIGKLVKTDLKQRRDRQGNGLVQITGFYLENSKGAKITSTKSGESLTLVFKYRSKNKITKKVDFGFSLHVNDFSTLTILYSSYMNKFLELKARDGEIKFTIPSVPLNQGIYKIGVRLLVNGEESDAFLNEIAEIIVNSGDYYHTQRLMQENDAPLLINGEWNV